ncbi:hypothetical protein HDF24_21295 [Mucilaginibacter sp. X4EP1]|uniref:hypothetical protein n=1 Tax=Mucilaginibacter sp. X4EP1 TaxID=2723092 RepID=UPI0021680768|nr:hypothetical protein [Mucilaginibacter sp. X4EP1]MCS3812483.1 ABC-type multidrug transport system fused ATPase/permease subunit [Mucilaginibacter sp. X4EP1]
MTQISHSKNAAAGIIAAIIASIVSLRIGRRFVPIIPFANLLALVTLCFLGIIIYLFVQKIKAKQKQLDPPIMFAFWQDVIRYFLAMDMTMFALQKIFHLQFQIPLGVLDNPFNSLDGEQLVWAFFGKFYAFTVIIASLQITAAVMMLFSKTRLLGTIILLPILFNILLLDWFYDLGIVVNLYITLLTLATVYLLLTEYSRLKEFFFVAKSNLPVFTFKNRSVKNILRASAIVIPVLLIACCQLPRSYPQIFGKYEVKDSGIIDPSSNLNTGCENGLTKIFIDDHDFVFQFGSYENRFIGAYQYNKHNKAIKVIWRYPETQHDTLYGVFSFDKNVKILSGHMGKRKINIRMVKVN